MKKTSLIPILALAFVLLGIPPAYPADAVEPNMVTFTNFRGQAEASILGSSCFSGSTLLMTNCAIKSGTSATGTVQGLSGVTVDVTIGNTSSNVHYTATVMSTNLGTWYCSVIVPTNAVSQAWVQIKVTDANTNIYIYPWQYFMIRDPL